MKGIFVLLLLANLVVAGWFLYSKSTETGVPAAKPMDVAIGNLQLTGKSTVTNKLVESQKAEGICYSIGVFNLRTEVEQAQVRLKSLDIGSSIESKNKNVVKDYWVYLEPFSSFQEAKRKLSELNLKGMDSFIFSEGELQNGLSLGVYSNRSNASAVYTQVESLGYRPRIKESFQHVEVFYLLLDKQGSTFYNSNIIDSLRERFPEIDDAKIDC